ncbi:hypothetical protein [Xanthobacter versatilis]|uniref:hypothetical protein n=1 Tax=Xanthobacter autotrophicus (strain ATCC BAA-1158 / Py2) TaxID=78245 RepID=UPI00372A0833
MGDTKHLELLQTNIQRLAGNGFIIKGWSVTLLTVILGATLKEGEAAFALFGIAPIVIFWGLDGYFLTLERGFRQMYDPAATRARQNEPPSFDMTPPPVSAGSVLKAMGSAPVFAIYVPAILILLLAAACL